MTVEASVAIGADNSQLLRVLQESKSAMSEFFVSVTEEGQGLGGMLEDIQGKFTNAFNFAGLTVGIEMIKQVGEAIEQMGQKAVELRSMADVLGVTTDQMQAMQEASEHAGVSQETLVRTGERLISILTEARNGSGAAVEKLIQLGVTTDQINDPMFKLNDLIGVLHDRLTDTATAQETMNELLAVLGTRAGLAAEAIKKYDGSEESVREVLAEVNGLTGEQNNKLATAGISWAEFSTKVENSSKKALLAMADMGNWMRDHSSTLSAVADAVGAPKSQTNASSGGAFDASINIAEQQAKEIGDLAESLARQQVDANQKAQLAELDSIKQSVAAFREGSTQKLEALQREHALAQEIYGSDQVDKVKAIYQQIIAEERTVYDAGLQTDQETIAREDRRVQAVLRGYSAQIEASGQYLQRQEEDGARALQITRQQMQQDDQAAALRLKSISLSLGESERFLSVQQRDAQLFQQRWGGAFRTFQNAFSTAIDGMLRGGESFGEAMRGVFASIAESALQNAVKNIATMAMQSLAGDAIRSAEIKKDAGAAAGAAYKAVVGIPYVGPFLAPAAAAVAYAGVLAFESAEGGYDIPGGINPVTQLHQREMVLPAPIADTVRSAMTRGGSTVHIHGGKNSTFTQDQLADMLKSLGHRFKLA